MLLKNCSKYHRCCGVAQKAKKNPPFFPPHHNLSMVVDRTVDRTMDRGSEVVKPPAPPKDGRGSWMVAPEAPPPLHLVPKSKIERRMPIGGFMPSHAFTHNEPTNQQEVQRTFMTLCPSPLKPVQHSGTPHLSDKGCVLPIAVLVSSSYNLPSLRSAEGGQALPTTKATSPQWHIEEENFAATRTAPGRTQDSTKQGHHCAHRDKRSSCWLRHK